METECSGDVCAHSIRHSYRAVPDGELLVYVHTHTEIYIYIYVYLMCSLYLKSHLRPHQANLWVDDGRS